MYVYYVQLRLTTFITEFYDDDDDDDDGGGGGDMTMNTEKDSHLKNVLLNISCCSCKAIFSNINRCRRAIE